MCDMDLMPLLRQPLLQEGRHAPLVFDYQNSHAMTNMLTKESEELLKRRKAADVKGWKQRTFSIFSATRVLMRMVRSYLLLLLTAALPAGSQTLTISLHDALSRARHYGTQIQAANTAVELAKEDRKQAKAATLPSISGLNQYIYT